MPAASERMDRLIQLSVPGLLPEYALLDEWALWLEIWVRALRDSQMAKERETLDRRWVQSISEVITGTAGRPESSRATRPTPTTSRWNSAPWWTASRSRSC